MSGKTITIVDFELQSCDGNLLNLAQSWQSMPNLTEDPISVSTGQCADSAKLCVTNARDLVNEVAVLLENTAQFLGNVGVSFQKADTLAAEQTQSLVT